MAPPQNWTFDYWFVHYHHIHRHELIHTTTEVKLPEEYYEKARQYIKKAHGGWNGNQGVLWRVRDWGADLLHLDILRNHYFDLPPPRSRKRGETMVIGSKKHPFRIFAPNEKLMGTYDCWSSYGDTRKELEEIRKTFSAIKTLKPFTYQGVLYQPNFSFPLGPPE